MSRRLPPSPVAHECIILAIDPGADSGWAIMGARTIYEAGTARAVLERNYVVTEALQRADIEGLPLVVAAEKWTAGGWKTAATPMGLGAQWGRWQEQLEWAGHPKRRIVRVYPQTWRARVGVASTKKAAMAYVSARWPGIKLASHDTADAICIGVWGQHAGEVAAVLPKTRPA